MMKNHFHDRLNAMTRQRGVAAVEFGLLATLVLVPLFFAAIDYGRAIYQYNTVVKSARAAARYLGAYDLAAMTVTDYNTVVANATNLAKYGGLTAGTIPLVPALQNASLTVNSARNGGAYANQTTGAFGAVNLVSVQISGATFSMLTSWIGMPQISGFEPITAVVTQL